MCNKYCSHGGVCDLEQGHEGQHDTGYCKFTDEESITKDVADEIIAQKMDESDPIQSLYLNLFRDFT